MTGAHEPADRLGDPKVDLDVIQPFQLDRSDFRGRAVRLGPALSEIIGRHAYPAPVARLLAETITLAVTLAATLKYDGIFTLQAQGDGPVAVTVADVTSGGDVRGYAKFDAGRVATLADLPGPSPIARLLGKGYLTFTVDQGEFTERYQGIVELDGPHLVDSVRHYFRQSEQLATGIKMAVAERQEGGWTGGAVLVQALPDAELSRGEIGTLSMVEEDDWRRSMALLESATAEELTEPRLAVQDLLYRLFHEETVRVFASHHVVPSCRCSRGRVETVLRALGPEELADMKVDGRVEVTCEFCNTLYAFDDSDLARLYPSKS
jgi:molecular chaperone Hsp33